MTQLKIGKVPDRTPTKLTVALELDLADDLADYARVYEDAYGEKAGPAALIPVMLRAFVDGDSASKRARKTLPDPQ